MLFVLNVGSEKITEFSQDNIYKNKYLHLVVATEDNDATLAFTISHSPQIFSFSSLYAIHAISRLFFNPVLISPSTLLVSKNTPYKIKSIKILYETRLTRVSIFVGELRGITGN